MAKLFRGSFNINMDAKGRIAMPTRLREKFQELADGQLVITVDLHKPCLLVYPLPDWEEIETSLQKAPSMNPDVRRIQRLIIGNAVDLELDGSGRVLVPQNLRQRASLDKKLVLAGQGNKLELWCEEQWQAECDAALDDIASGDLEVPAELMSFSL